MTVSYLDVDDEITIAVARLRAADEHNVLLVLPPGSRIATSRINFRLLAREALEHQRRLSIVSGDAGVRAIAVSAGLPAFGTVGEWEASVEEARSGGPAEPAAAGASVAGANVTGDAAAGATVATGETGPVEPAAGASDGPVASDPPKPPVSLVTAASATAVQPTPATPISVALPAPPPATATSRGLGPRSAARDLPVDDRRAAGRPWWERLGRTPLLVAAALAALVLVLGGVGGFLLLPTAAITVTPRAEPAGPVTVTIRADPGATGVEAANAVVP
ncbi:MAG TPA: hypothetical protein VFK38_01060, partial [Candidatus Limnocylindrales bacterium]|nr:hypothetical protein [Candidatus Limnocylindrales bacterium]